MAGIRRLPASITRGRDVKIALLDSGIPTVGRLRRRMKDAPSGQDDVLGHATSVASILFGGRGLTGLCEQAQAAYVKVLDNSGAGSTRSVSEGIERAISMKSDIINLSLGFARTDKCPRDLEKACRKAYDSGIPVICAAGNDSGPVNWPAALECTVSVGSAGSGGLKASFSSVGEIDVIAPGENIDVLDVRNRLTRVSGTSFSTAIVTGVAALLISDMKSRGDAVSCDAIRERIRLLAEDVGEEGWDPLTGFGVIGGKYHDPTVRQEIGCGFFAKIRENIRGLLGLV